MMNKISLHKKIIIGIVLVCLVIIVISLWYPPTAHKEVSETTTFEKPSKIIVVIYADKEILHYKNQTYWDENAFKNILASKDQFIKKTVDSFKEYLTAYGLDVINPRVVFNEENKTVTFLCDINGTMYAPNSYNFYWVVQKLPVDLYGFKQLKNKLIYEGVLNGVSIKIILVFPYTLEHCHAHVWPANQ